MTDSLRQYLAGRAPAPVKLHLGCGGVRRKDFVNVDLYPIDESRPDSSRDGCVADVFADIRALGLPDDSVDEIFTAHTLEHFTRWVAIDMLRDWYRMLRPSGRMVIEMPDFWRCVAWLFSPNAKRRRVARVQFYGNQQDGHDFETHRYLWSSGEFRDALGDIGFSRVTVSHRTETHFSGRDMRVEALK
jgi:predicted SAM-dependent methyltransferase